MQSGHHHKCKQLVDRAPTDGEGALILVSQHRRWEEGRRGRTGQGRGGAEYRMGQEGEWIEARKGTELGSQAPCSLIGGKR